MTMTNKYVKEKVLLAKIKSKEKIKDSKKSDLKQLKLL